MEESEEGLIVTRFLRGEYTAWETMFHHLLSEEGMYQPSHQVSEEELIVTRCLRGEYTAWETMFHHYHPRLVSIIKAEMNWRCSTDQAEEIAASIWCSLCSEAYSRLRRYDPRLGRLLTYLKALARREIWKRTRQEKKRRARERRSARKEATMDETEPAIVIQEFLAILTRRERAFCQSYLMKQSGCSCQSEISSSNYSKLQGRVMKKFRKFVLDKG